MLTEEQINKAALKIFSEVGVQSTIEKVSPLLEDEDAVLKLKWSLEAVQAMGNWVQEQLTPKWVPCKHKEVLPEGYYMLLFKANDIEGVLFQEINKKTPRVLYYNIVAYCRISMPVPYGK